MSTKILIFQKFVILLSTTTSTRGAEQEIKTVISPWSAKNDDAETFAVCPGGYVMVGCKLADDSTNYYADGLYFTGSNDGCVARGNNLSGSVKVTVFSCKG